MKSLLEDLKTAMASEDHDREKSIIEQLEIEKEKESLYKWVWYR